MTPSRALIPLILLTLALSLAAVALIVNGALQLPTVEEIAGACTGRFVQSQEPPQCSEPTPVAADVNTVGPTVTYPGFSYPATMNAVLTAEGDGTRIVLAVGGLFTSCPTCTEGVVITITTGPFALDGTETLDSYVQAAYASNTTATIKKEVQGNGTKYTIDGNALEAPYGPFTHVLFFGSTLQSSVLLPGSDLLPVGVAERDAFLSSLDFSLIP